MRVICSFTVVYILFVGCFLSNAFAQKTISGKIVNKENKEPVVFANIWILNTNYGNTSTEDGFFTITVGSLLDYECLKISAIGFYDTIIGVTSSNLEISLNPKTYELSEVTVLPRKQKTLLINKLTKSEINAGISCDTTPQIAGLYFAYKPEYELFRYIKSIIVYARDMQKGVFNLRLYSFDTVTVQPISELVNVNILVETKPASFGQPRPINIDVSEYSIIFPKEGMLVGIEWLIIPRNEYKITETHTANPKKTYIKTRFSPNLGATLSDNDLVIYIQKGIG